MIGQALGGEELIRLVDELEARGEPYAVATVVARRAPVSARVGDRAVVTADGRMTGWVGGACSQSAVRREALAAIRSGRPRLLRLATREEATPLPAESGVAEGEEAAVALTCPSGGAMEVFIEPRVAPPRLVVVGETPLTRALVRMGETVGFDVAALPGRGEPAQEAPGSAAPAAPRGDGRPPGLEALPELVRDRPAYVVVASAGICDEEALALALRTEARYVGLVASRRRARAVREVLAGWGLEEAQLARIRNPAGLDIGAATQEEIALSILAELVAERRRAERAAPRREAEPGQAPPVAEDPVCGMQVEVDAQALRAEYAGGLFYFCGEPCRQRFLREPERYLPGGAPPAAAGDGSGAGAAGFGGR
ncbi:MAG: XdhC family protein [Bacillota bacterium]|nr:XdhC family protein [Bacillota bacterium]